LNPCPSTLVLIFFLLAVSAPVSAWGRTGHRLVAELALKDLPPDVRAWLEGHEHTLLEHSSDPDSWRHDRKEARRHYLHTESYGGPEGVPFEAQEAIRKVGTASFQKSGQVPWIIQDRLRDLVEAFRQRDRARIALAATVMGHYLADLHVPLHTTRNHDGQHRQDVRALPGHPVGVKGGTSRPQGAGGPPFQSSDQQGIHGRWETGLVERFVRLEALTLQPARLEPGLKQAPWKWLQESNALVPKLLEDDRAADRTRPRGKRRGQAYWKHYWELQGPVVQRQLSRAGHRLAQMILYAWTLAGSPSPATTLRDSPR